jgi:ATP-dependent Clp protease ATP-binding subunit ClpA
MFERFTDRARNVLVLANGQANQLGHNYIGTEHMLLGMILEGEGVAAKVLESFQITDDAVRAKVGELTEAGQVGPPARATHKPPFTPLAKKSLEQALRQALALHHNYIGTEHILLAVAGETSGLAQRILVELGADPGQVRDCILSTLAQSDPGVVQRTAGAGEAKAASRAAAIVAATGPTWSPAVEEAMAHAGASVADGNSLTTAELLAALVRATTSRAGRMLAAAGLTEERLAELLAAVPLEGTSDWPWPPVSISVQDRTTVVDDPEVARFLLSASPEEIREALRRGLPGPG